MRKGAIIKRKHLRNFFLFLLLLIGINIAFSYVRFRIDLTAEKRFTLSEPTKKLLQNLDGVVRIKVFLKGDFPSGFRHLAVSTRDLLEEFHRYAGRNLRYEFINLLAGLPDSLQHKVSDSLAAMGIMPYNVKAQQELSKGVSVQLVFPAALIDYKGHQLPVDLLQPQPGVNPLESLNRSIALLEYDFAHAIEQLSHKAPPLVAYMIGNKETLDPTVYDALMVLQQNFRFDTLNLSTASFIPQKYKALVFLNPTKPFTEDEKLKIDQYVMHGGRILWAINTVDASMDSLQTKTSFLAYNKGLNLDDLLFTYGIRINPDLVQDLQCFSIPVTVGHIGNRPQIERLPWPFEPLLMPASDHPVTNNLDAVLSQFPSSIDTTKLLGVKKTILLATSPKSKTLGTPVRISLESVKVKPDPRKFAQAHIPIAVLLEGKFPSVFRNRLDQTMLKKINSRFHHPFKSESVQTRMIVVADGNMFTNAVSRQDGPLPMGMDPYTRQLFANRQFFENCLTYLTDTSGIMQARNKDFKLRLLDKTKVQEQKSTWQALNFLIPLAFVLLFALVFQYVRKRKYAE